jgi:hypothetical protein
MPSSYKYSRSDTELLPVSNTLISHYRPSIYQLRSRHIENVYRCNNNSHKQQYT